MELKVQADRIEWAAESAVAEGNVWLIWGEERLEAQRATWTPTGLVLERGHWERAAEKLSFERAEILLPPETVMLYEARLDIQGASLAAGRLELGKERWEGEDATLVPCTCTDGGPPALSFSARAFQLRARPNAPEEPTVLLLQGGMVRLFRLPVLPLPVARIPLNPQHFRLHLPELGYGSKGWSAGWSAQGGIEGWMLEGGPTWRQDRGFAAEVKLEGPKPPGDLRATAAPVVQAQGGWDQIQEKWRGSLQSRGAYTWDRPESRWSRGDSRLAWDLGLVSDPGFTQDYAPDWVARGVRWQEQRGLFESGATSIQAWHSDDGSPGPLLVAQSGLELSRRDTLRPSLGLALEAQEEGLRPVPQAGLELEGGRTRGPVHGAVQAAGLAQLWGLDELRGQAVAEAQVDLSVWGQSRRLRALWWPGLRMRGAIGEKEAWGLGPGVDLRINGPNALLIGEARLLWTEKGWSPEGSLWLDVGDFSAEMELQPAQQQVQLRWDQEWLQLGLASRRSDAGWLARAEGEWLVKRLRLGSDLAWDFYAQSWSGAGLGLGYDDGCSLAMLRVGFSPDRSLPDVGLRVELRR